ncbi:uncharacterized protein LOC127799193 isoform X2 [Diospyros lotus]|uniref:uncharacterized protein LOC127799193 isoform X2 n=1 Tax=Diospyros lotus TaxID=55363 RepID=UPI00225A4706|nr:uncharacterized protein LOC127799193 isoform X2 [Diospyros lotus]
MTGGRCHQRTKMMGRGAAVGCGTEQKACPISRVPAKLPAEEAAGIEKPAHAGLDLYAQARKALCERSPFDTEEAQVSTVTTLPSGLARFLSKHSDGRKRHKRVHSGGEAKSSRVGGAVKARGPNIWAEAEQYFRELTGDDIDKLQELSYFAFSDKKCFSIPVLGNSVRGDASNGDNVNDVNGNGPNGVGSDCGLVVKEELEQSMEVDQVGAITSLQEEKSSSSLPPATPCSGLEWLLGSRNKVYLTSDRPSKKRKLLGCEAGLEKLLVARPIEGSSSLCHYCSLGDTGNQLNCLVVCTSCNVAVHERCYGVQDDVPGSWLCSWCKQKNAVPISDRPCLLCPKQGGALKQVRKIGDQSGNSGPIGFAHLFCCQWMPEVYIQDTRTMEPIVNIEGIKETRRKLICSLCKVKYGACVRCSNGACRTSFHPICAREARHRMEIWGKFGCDDVELRAFCSKHSEVQNGSTTQQSGVGSDSYVTKHQPVGTTVNKLQKLKFGRKSGDKITVHVVETDTNVSKLGNSATHGEGLSDARSYSLLQPECGDSKQSSSADTLERRTNEEPNASDSLDFTAILKKLIDRGKVNTEDVASEIGVSPDSLSSMLSDDCLVPELRCKIVAWLRNHAYVGMLPKNLKVRIKSSIASKDDKGAAGNSDAVIASDSDIPDVVSVPPRRRTKSNIRILKDNKVKETINDDGIIMDAAKRGQFISESPDYSSKASVSDAIVKNLVEPNGIHDTLASHSPENEEGAAIIEQKLTPNLEPGDPIFSVTTDIIKSEAVSGTYIHPHIQNKMIKIQNLVLSDNASSEIDGDREIAPEEPSSASGICCYQQSQHLSPSDMIPESDGANLKQLVKAKNMGILDMCPEDEAEGELIFYQHRLLCNVGARKHLIDGLVNKVGKSLPWEIDAVRKQKWDAVIVNQYLHELREAKKQGRKERRHKEAQAVLAAATAAAAASSRVSSFRKDTLDESAHQENLFKVKTSTGRAGLYSQQIPRVKETLPHGLSEVSSDVAQTISSGFCKEDPRTCDICRRFETILNPILICSNCKVAVHLDCYHSVKDSTGPWYCELCEDLLSSRSIGPSAINSLEKPYFAAKCGLCGGSGGAFRRSMDDQWVHAFCAEWVLESTFRRGQVNPIVGLESVLKGNDICHICHHKQGVCIKCNYGFCQSMFHPFCARSSGLYMNVKISSGKFQHKAYCEKHSLEQRAKAEIQKPGNEELKSLKQIRVELERLRLLCERIIKREKLKRELVLCSQNILVSNRDTVALSALVRSPLFTADISSESATTSLRGNTDDCRSGSDTIQRSDDITVDSTVSGKRRIKFPVSMDNDQKTDDSSTSQQPLMKKPRERVSFSGKQIPHRPSFLASQNRLVDGEKRSTSRKG